LSFSEKAKSPTLLSGASSLVLFLLPISEYKSAPRAAKRKAKKKVAKVKLRAHGFSFKNEQSIPLSIVGFKWENLAGKIRRLLLDAGTGVL
jgi:hypothetical protein